MQLSLRLSAIAEMVTEGNRLVDVGCDHGYLPVYLVLNKKIPSAIAMDVRKGPLSRAEEHIAQFGMERYIETRLSDGLAALSSGEGDTLVIAGMGGPLMERILTDGASVRESFGEMILQPQSDIPHFRRFIRAQGWEIRQEDMVLEDGKFYPMMRVTKAESIPPYSREEEAFGKLLLDRRHPVLKEYLLRELRIRNDIAGKLAQAPKPSAVAERLQEVKEEQQLILAALKKYESL
ncbi:tRNA (adenine(22)-N(1))-methyltransferase TrmK [Ruminococcus sp. 5_1_39BFAA]|uniref:tRNA (adenine(22)-N(1))-methyltransferase n=1 Tax=Ruminococcus sp. 5_1_39BFAA TaxID=457412 RepID=UPI00356A3312